MKLRKLALTLGVAAALWGCATHEKHTPKAWQAVALGMPRENVHTLLGPPDTPRISRDQEIWLSQEWELNVFYDQYWRVTNIVQQYLLR